MPTNTAIRDQVHDQSGAEIYRFLQTVEPPDFVKQADAVAVCGDARLPLDCYADPRQRLFPCHTPAATWTSTLYFLDKKAEYRPEEAAFVAERLDCFARYHNIRESVQALRGQIEKAASAVEPELPDDAYGLVYEDQGRKVRRYPLRNAVEVKAAANYLYQYRDHFPYVLRREFADRVLQKAAEYGASVGGHDDYLERQAGYGTCPSSSAIALLRGRVKAAQKGPGAASALQTELTQLAGILEAAPEKLRIPGRLVKLAEVVDAFDRHTGLWRDYGELLKRPEDVLFELTQTKMAAAVNEHCSTTTGNVYRVADLEKLSLVRARACLGDDFAEAARRGDRIDRAKAAEIVPTMDRGMAELFDRMMAEAGLPPTAKEAAAAVGFSREELLELAAVV